MIGARKTFYAAALAAGALTQQPASAQTAAELEQQIAALQTQLKQKKIEEARAALAAEEAAVKRAAEARTYLATLGEAVPGPVTVAQAGTPAPPQPGPSDVTRIEIVDEEGNKVVQETIVPQGTITTTETSEDGKTKKTRTRAVTQDELAELETNSTKFGGIDFGVGIAFSADTGTNDRVREAELVNGIVRVTHSDNVRARLILESHYFFTPMAEDGVRRLPIFGLENTELKKTWGWGPFLAVQPSSEQVIDAIGGGVMVGLRKAGEGNDSFNIGLGLLVDLDTRILGDGILADQPLPAGETQIRFKRRDQTGVLLLSSFSF